ncbi:MAG TPA: DUF4404 family protein [Steroidobacteraceae bacterium]
MSESLRDLLERVHQRLRDAKSIDRDSRELLVTLMKDIEHALKAKPAKSGTHAPRLEALAVRFEAEHPELAGVLRQLVDTLGKAGI